MVSFTKQMHVSISCLLPLHMPYSAPAVLQAEFVGTDTHRTSLLSLFLETASVLLWALVSPGFEFVQLSPVARCHPIPTSSDRPGEQGAGHLKP